MPHTSVSCNIPSQHMMTIPRNIAQVSQHDLDMLHQGKAPIEATKPRIVYSETHHVGGASDGNLRVLVGCTDLHDLHHRNEAALAGTPRPQSEVDVGNSARAGGALPVALL